MEVDLSFDFERDLPIQYMLHVEMQQALCKGSEFIEWRYEVNKLINSVEPLLSAIDLCGQPYIEWYDQGLAPIEVADLVLDNLRKAHVPVG